MYTLYECNTNVYGHEITGWLFNAVEWLQIGCSCKEYNFWHFKWRSRARRSYCNSSTSSKKSCHGARWPQSSTGDKLLIVATSINHRLEASSQRKAELLFTLKHISIKITTDAWMKRPAHPTFPPTPSHARSLQSSVRTVSGSFNVNTWIKESANPNIHCSK